jgi:hypothetical protein
MPVAKKSDGNVIVTLPPLDINPVPDVVNDNVAVTDARLEMRSEEAISNRRLDTASPETHAKNTASQISMKYVDANRKYCIQIMAIFYEGWNLCTREIRLVTLFVSERYIYLRIKRNAKVD